MAPIAFLPILLATIAFSLVGLIWYGLLFAGPWRRLTGMQDDVVRASPRQLRRPGWLLLVLAFLFEMLIALVLAHQFAMTGPSDRAIWMISIGFGAFVISPAVGITYLFQGKPGALFAIDAGYFVCGMAAMGAVFVAFN